MRTFAVVVMPPEGNLLTPMTARVEPMLVEALDKRTRAASKDEFFGLELRVTKAPIEALDKGILHRLSGLNEA